MTIRGWMALPWAPAITSLEGQLQLLMPPSPPSFPTFPLTSLEGQLQLRPRDDDVGEVQQVHLEGVQHSLAGHDDALGLLLYREGPDKEEKVREMLWIVECPG